MITVSKALENATRIGGKSGLNCIAGLIETANVKQIVSKSASEGPLAGVPVLVKDNIDVAGFPTTAGSLALEDNLATNDAPVIRNLRRNGAVIIGKTNLTEFANYVSPRMPGGSRGGQVKHAVSPDLDPLGSSTGSAVAVAAGIVPMAVGTDTCHSITGCAWGNGICGLKPPAGVLSKEGILPLSKTFDSAGAMAMNMTDTIRLYSAMRSEPLSEIKPITLAKLRVAVNIANADGNPEEKRAFLNELIMLMKANGVQMGEVNEPMALQVPTIMKWEFKTSLEEYLKTSTASLKTLKEIVEFYEANPETMMKYGDDFLRAALNETTSNALYETEYCEAMEARKKAIRDVQDEISGYDAERQAVEAKMQIGFVPDHYALYVTVAFDRKDANGVRQTVILYGTDECRLYAAALTIEGLVNTQNH